MNNSSIIGISVLSAIFFGALITLVVILRKRLRTSLKLISSQCNRGCVLLHFLGAMFFQLFSNQDDQSLQLDGSFDGNVL